MIERYTLPEIGRIWSDENKFSIWLQIEIFACEANSKLGIVPVESLKAIKKKARFDIDGINKLEEKIKHDVIAFLTNVGLHVGKDSRYIHYGMTSSDVLDTSFSVQMKQAGNLILEKLKELTKIVARQARKYKYLNMVGRTHGVHAEPITLGLKFALWYDELNRCIERLNTAVRIISVGKISGAVGTFEHLNPKVEQYVCRNLGLTPDRISTQIIQRDRHAQYMVALALIGSSLDKFATEIRHLQKTEVLELEEPFTKGQKGSSAMPHKRNPVICERISGLARVLRGNALTAMENINLWHERDISHSSAERLIVPDSTMLLYYMLVKFIEVMHRIQVNKDNISRNLNLTNGLISSQRVLLKLIEKGMGREEAYSIVQDNAMKSWRKGQDFKQLISSDKQIQGLLSESEIGVLFELKTGRRNIDFIFRRVGL
jgi:adenylosuccinate lyase